MNYIIAAGSTLQNGIAVDLKNENAGIFYLHTRSASGSSVMKVVRY